MNAQERADAEAQGYSVWLQERSPGNFSYWVFLNNNEVGGPFGSEPEGWDHVKMLQTKGSYGMGN
ncbi:hypothetical protein [Pseudomonas sp. 3-2]|uniref:hypothetical protein n=1 Tax=Pseudomonas sp. 3-2 TaxID=2867408 RepID=UPI001C881E40|nr:hypothetical protein [Pseudomonas sp. 3-2]QZD72065.1 hypothetical protein K3819_04195 [Pseudomonas sp. 3-2]